MNFPIFAFDRNVRPIERIEFDVLGSDEIKGHSALDKNTQGVEFSDLYENGEARIGGSADPRFGTIDNNNICATCGFNTNYCPGHSGHMDLVEPFFHIGFLDHHVKKILDCICLKCSRVLIHKNESKIEDILRTKTGKARLIEVANYSKNITYCTFCGTHVSKIKVEIKKSTATIVVTAEIDLESLKDENLVIDGKKKIKQNLTPEIIYEKLKNISDDDCKIIGLIPSRTRPEYMIHKTLLIPPMAIRPSAKGDFGGNSVMEDGLTHRLVDIIKFNYKLLKQKEMGNETLSKYSKDQATLLQYHIAAYFDKDLISTSKGSDNDKHRSLAPGIKAKEGRIRGNLMGKRTDFTGRTVITSDPVIGNNELRVPVRMAMTITFPEVVTPANIDKLSKLVLRGRDLYPGANNVFPVANMTPGKTIWPMDLRFKSKDQIELHYGDIVERHLQTGDIVLLNRQPTLHKQSMMGHRIKVIDDQSLMTFGLSVAVTKPYNADFDKHLCRKQEA